MKKILALLVATVVMIGLFAACDKTEESSKGSTYVSLTINPSIELTLDSDDIITSVNSLNEDAEILLSDTNLVGMTIEEGAEKFVNLATEAGYIDIKNQDNEVTVEVINENEDQAEKIHQNIEAKVNKFFENHGIYGKVSKETLKQYGEQAAELGLSVAKTKMVLRAHDLYPEKTIEQLSVLSIKELIDLLKEKVKEENLGQKLHDQFKLAKENLKEKYAEMFTLQAALIELRANLATFEGTEEQKAALTSEIEQKQAQYDALKQQYNAEVKTLLEDFKAQYELKKEEYKAIHKEKRDKLKQKLEEHKEQFEKNKQDFMDKLEQWRNLKR